MTSKSAPIVIIGAGVFGLSAALQLASEGYTDVTVLEKDDQMPSRGSAGYDLNKIVRPEYEDPWYTELTIVSPPPSLHQPFICIHPVLAPCIFRKF